MPIFDKACPIGASSRTSATITCSVLWRSLSEVYSLARMVATIIKVSRNVSSMALKIKSINSSEFRLNWSSTQSSICAFICVFWSSLAAWASVRFCVGISSVFRPLPSKFWKYPLFHVSRDPWQLVFPAIPSSVPFLMSIAPCSSWFSAGW